MADFYRITLGSAASQSKFAPVLKSFPAGDMTADAGGSVDINPASKFKLFIGRIDGKDLVVSTQTLDIQKYLVSRMKKSETLQLATYVQKGLAVVKLNGTGTALTPDEVIKLSYLEVE